MTIIDKRSQTLIVTVTFNPPALTQDELIDSLNEYFHRLGGSLGSSNDDGSGGYEHLDWGYQK